MMKNKTALIKIFNNKFEVDTEQILSYYKKIEEQANRIHKTSTRPYDVILKNCFEGSITELGILNALAKYSSSAKLNPKEFNFKDLDSYCWDVEVNINSINFRFEIKSMKNINPIQQFFFNYHIKRPGLDLSTYIDKGISKTDFLILAAYIQNINTCSYTILPKYIFSSNHFKSYMKRSTHNDTLSHYVSIEDMINNNHAIKLSCE
jgi:hypothetical protein